MNLSGAFRNIVAYDFDEVYFGVKGTKDKTLQEIIKTKKFKIVDEQTLSFKNNKKKFMMSLDDVVFYNTKTKKIITEKCRLLIEMDMLAGEMRVK